MGCACTPTALVTKVSGGPTSGKVTASTRMGMATDMQESGSMASHRVLAHGSTQTAAVSRASTGKASNTATACIALAMLHSMRASTSRACLKGMVYTYLPMARSTTANGLAAQIRAAVRSGMPMAMCLMASGGPMLGMVLVLSPIHAACPRWAITIAAQWSVMECVGMPQLGSTLASLAMSAAWHLLLVSVTTSVVLTMICARPSLQSC
mmetsp:Transcript_84692/g.169138  ORF Transcript_84692/g.169138 Transcript_84692/m.169138 type:complete len:209 (+) Transcript_84692:1660-2286(+)